MHAIEESFIKLLEQLKINRLLLITPDGASLSFGTNTSSPEVTLHLYKWEVVSYFIEKSVNKIALSYSQGLWDTNLLPAIIDMLILQRSYNYEFTQNYCLLPIRKWPYLEKTGSHIFKSNQKLALEAICKYYDMGNSFFSLWLDPGMSLNTGLFKKEQKLTLYESQKNLHAYIFKQLRYNSINNILDIDCNWGSFLESAITKGIDVVGITPSSIQAEFCKNKFSKTSSPCSYQIYRQNYLDMQGSYDAIVSIESLNRLPSFYWDKYFKKVSSSLQKNGTFLLNVILSCNYYPENKKTYFNSLSRISSITDNSRANHELICKLSSKYNMSIVHRQNLSSHSIKTLYIWKKNFESNLEIIQQLGFDRKVTRSHLFDFSWNIAKFEAKRLELCSYTFQKNIA